MEHGILFERLHRDTADAITIAELGCGIGEHLGALRAPHRVGVEIFGGYLDASRWQARGSAKVREDLRPALERWYRDGTRFDVALMLDVLEMLPRADGERALFVARKVAQRVVVFTPDGVSVPFAKRPNPHQERVSSWMAADFATGWHVETWMHKDTWRYVYAVGARQKHHRRYE